MLQGHFQDQPTRSWAPAPRISLQEYPELRSLLEDDRFRQELKTHPAEALARFGVHLEADDVPETVELPTPDNYVLKPWEGLF